jgi:hypothetical protein
MGISVLPVLAATAKEKRVETFTASGTFTVPSGVTYAIAYIQGGGGGTGASSAAGGSSSVAFAGGTVTANGGGNTTRTLDANEIPANVAGANNSGRGATGYRNISSAQINIAGDGSFVVAGDAVTPAGSITVTVGAAGTAGTFGSAGGSGLVYIEYYE